jgi:hypothetical protein
MIQKENLSRFAGLGREADQGEARSDEGEGAANRTVPSCAANSTVLLVAPSPGAARRPLPRSGRG